MEKIKKFLENLTELECFAHIEYRKRNNIQEYNSSRDRLYSLTINDTGIMSEIGFGLAKMSKPHAEDFFEDLDIMVKIRSRHLYKISEYNNEKYGTIWACYASVANPAGIRTKSLANCFIVAKIDEDYKIVAQFNPDMDTKIWSFRGGDRTIEYRKLGKPIAIERIMSPDNDEWSIEEYLKDR